MATKIVNYTSLVNSRTPSTGWMTIGENSSSVNRHAQVTFPALGVTNGVITSVKLHYMWNNDSAGEGFAASTQHRLDINGNLRAYGISGSSGSGSVELPAGWSNTQSFVVDIRGHLQDTSTSKGYTKSSTYLYLEVTYTPYTAPGAPTSCSASPDPFEGAITISWSGASAGSGNPITGYELERSINGDAWTFVKTVASTGTSGSTTDTPTVTRGQSVRYRVRTEATYAPLYSTSYATSGYCKKNELPRAISDTPTVNHIYRLSGETVRISFTNPGNEDNLQGFQAGDADGNILGTRADPAATYVDVVANWTAGTNRIIRIRGYDLCQAVTNYGPWSDPSSSVTVVTVATAPSSISPSNNSIHKDIVTVEWSGASGGSGSPITGYRLRYRKVGDANYTFEDVAANVVSKEFNLATLGVARGSGFEVGIMTLTESGYHSDYTASRTYYRNQLPSTPSNLGPAAGSYPTSVNLTWSASSDPDGHSITYRLRVYQKPQGAGSFSLYETLTSGTNSYSYPIGSKPIGEYYFLIDSLDSLGEYSATAAQSPTYKNNTAPAVPTIVFPKAGSTTRNPNPRIGVRFGADNEGDLQSGVLEYNSVEFSSMSSSHWSTQGRVFQNNGQALVQGFTQAASMSVRAKASDGNLESDYSAARSFSYQAVSIPSYQGQLIVAQYLLNIRTAVNGVRDYFNLSAYNWQQPCAAGVLIRTGAAIVGEIRTAIDQIITYINSFDSAGSSAKRVTPPTWISIGVPLNNLAFRQSLEQLWNIIATL